MFKHFVDIFSSIFGSEEIRRLSSDKIENETMRTITPCLPAQNSSASRFLSFGGKIRTPRPSKIKKNCDFSKLEVCHQNENEVYQHIFNYLSLLKI